jgi:multidrug efflux system membrane fusion protein
MVDRRRERTPHEREPANVSMPNIIREAPPPEEKAPRPGHRVRNIILSLGVVILVVVIALTLRHRSASQAQQKAAADKGRNRAVPVAVAPVTQQDVPVYLDGLGNVNAVNTVTVKTRIDGQLVRFNFQEGQEVRAGAELALIDPRPSEATLAQAQATLFRDQASLHNAQLDLKRFADLFHSGVVSQQQYNTQQSQVGVTEGNVRADEAQVEQAKLNVNYCHIIAPISGRVGIRAVDPGNMVHASDANGLLVIAQEQPITAIFTLPEDNLAAVTPHLRRGDPMLVEAWSRDSTQLLARGKLLTIDNQIDPNTGTFRCKAIFDNRDGALFPNQFVNARLQVNVLRNALTIPAAAVQHGSQGTYVYVVHPDKSVDARTITVALTEGTTIVAGSGLQPGEQVVTDGADKLQPKSKVEIAGAGGGGGGRGGAGGGKRGGGHGGGQKRGGQQEPAQ